MKRKKAPTTPSDRLFAETKLKMVMKLNNMTRRQAAENIANRARTSASASKRDLDDELMSAEEFFGD